MCPIAKGPRGYAGPPARRPEGRKRLRGSYESGSLLATLPKVFDRRPPSSGRPAAMATATRAAIRPYSMAVAPDSSLQKRVTNLDMEEPPEGGGDRVAPFRRSTARLFTPRL